MAMTADFLTFIGYHKIVQLPWTSIFIVVKFLLVLSSACKHLFAIYETQKAEDALLTLVR